jgi:hypothetical protein
MHFAKFFDTEEPTQSSDSNALSFPGKPFWVAVGIESQAQIAGG